MKRSEINRKTPLKRGAKPIPKVSRKYKSKFTDKAIQSSYRQNNPGCELWKIIRLYVQDALPHGTELHHIMGSRKGRADMVTNLIMLSKPAHDWCHKFRTEGNVLCLWVKLAKGELSWSEFEAASGYKRTVICNWEPRFQWVEPYWQRLVSEVTENNA